MSWWREESPKEIRERAYRDCGKTILRIDFDIPWCDWWKIPKSQWICGRPGKWHLVTPEECEEEFRKRCKSRFPSRRRRPGSDTRRRKWKLFGEHHGKQWYSSGAGKDCKGGLHRAERRMWKQYAREFSGLTPRECLSVYDSGHDIRDRGYSQNYSSVDWRND